MSEDFFSRWSRRKREVREAKQAEPRPPEPAQDAPDAVEPQPSAAPEQAALTEPELAREALQELPALDALTADTDLSAFFKKGVPQGLRNAALRRMWSLDPAIRDYVGDARDYAWDWNVPEGVPGYGPLAPTDEIYATLDQMFSPQETAEAGRERREDHAAAPGQSVASPHCEAPAPGKERSDPEAEAAQSLAAQKNEPELSSLSAEESGDGTVASETPVTARPSDVAASQQLEPASAQARPRRHGGAAPH